MEEPFVGLPKGCSPDAVAERIKHVRLERRWKQGDFAKKIGVSPSYLSEVESKKVKASLDLILGVVKFVGDVDVQWLLTGVSVMRETYVDQPESEWARVPYFDIPISAGAGRQALDGAATYDIAYRREYVHRRGLVAANLIELPVAGDSMSPELESGDTVLVDRSRINIAGDGIYVIAMDGLLYCKRLQLLPGRLLRVISINPSYAPFDVHLSDEDGQGEHIEIIGRVVRQGRDR